MTVLESWLLIVGVCIALGLFTAGCSRLLDWVEDRRQAKERARWAADLLANVEPVNEASSRALFDALMVTGARSSLDAQVVPTYQRTMRADVFPQRRVH
jgi:hypothetical protein